MNSAAVTIRVRVSFQIMLCVPFNSRERIMWLSIYHRKYKRPRNRKPEKIKVNFAMFCNFSKVALVL